MRQSTFVLFRPAHVHVLRVRRCGSTWPYRVAAQRPPNMQRLIVCGHSAHLSARVAQCFAVGSARLAQRCQCLSGPPVAATALWLHSMRFSSGAVIG
jgi:hypothetical protein